jgi:hypothetical protein
VRRETARFTQVPTALKHLFGLLASRQAALSDPRFGGAPCSKARAISQQAPPSYRVLLSRWQGGPTSLAYDSLLCTVLYLIT